jgi:hypothetical protein
VERIHEEGGEKASYSDLIQLGAVVAIKVLCVCVWHCALVCACVCKDGSMYVYMYVFSMRFAYTSLTCIDKHLCRRWAGPKSIRCYMVALMSKRTKTVLLSARYVCMYVCMYVPDNLVHDTCT